MVRVLQWVAPRGVVSSVRITTSSTFASVICRGAPTRGSSNSPATRSATKRARHLHTVTGDIRNRRGTVLFSRPSAQASTIRARRAMAGADRDRCASDSSSRRSSSVNTNAALGRPVRMRDSPSCVNTPTNGDLFHKLLLQDTRANVTVERIGFNPHTAQHSTQKSQNSQNKTGLFCEFHEFCDRRGWVYRSVDSAISRLYSSRA